MVLAMRDAEEVRLCRREREVLALIAEGYGNKEIAATLRKDDGRPLSEHYVAGLVKSLMAKSGTHARGALVAWAYRAGLRDD